MIKEVRAGNARITYISGSQPGFRVPPGVREKSQGVRQFEVFVENVLKMPYHNLLGGTRAEKGWEPLTYIIG